MGNLYIYDNAAVLSAYQKLEQEDKHPVLGVWRNKSLLIISHDSDISINSIVNTIKQIFYKIFNFIGFINTDLARIQEIKAEIENHYFSHVENHYNRRLSALQLQEINLMHTVHQLNKRIASVKGELQNIGSDLSEAQALVSQKNSLQFQVQSLLQRKADLERVINSLPNRQAELASLEKSITGARQCLSSLSIDISQKDYKERVRQLGSENAQLKASLENAKRNVCINPWQHFQ